MNFVNKLLCLLFYCMLVTEVFAQKQSYISTNGNINNSFIARIIYNMSTFTPLKKNNSIRVLDSLICISTNSDRSKIAYNYNDDLSLNYFTKAVWYNGEWIDSERHTNTYNSEGKLISVMWELFNSTTKEWFKDAKDIYNYDSLGNKDFHIHQYFNGQEFVNTFKYENYFKGINLISSIQLNWIDSEWSNGSKIINTFSLDNLKVSTINQKWTNNQWINSLISNYEYDENHNRVAILTKIWQEKQFIDYASGIFEYDVNNNLVLENWQIAGNNTWVNWFRISYEYDDNNNLIKLYGEEWENDQWIPENELLIVTNPDGISFGYLAKEIFLFHSEPTSVGSENNTANGFNLLQNYPNPFNPATNIFFSIKEVGLVNVKVFDLTGQLVSELVNEEKEPGSYSIPFDASNLPSGIYIYTINAKNFNQHRKMLLMK